MDSTAKDATVLEPKPTPPFPSLTELGLFVLSYMALFLGLLATALGVVAGGGVLATGLASLMIAGIFRCATELMTLTRIFDIERHIVKIPVSFHENDDRSA